MIKMVSHSLLVLLLLTATTGMAVSKHYCSEYFISASLFSGPDPCCDQEKCCHNEPVFYQVDEDFTTPCIAQLPLIVDFDLLVVLFVLPVDLFLHEKPADFAMEGDLPLPPKIHTALSLKQSWLL